jgi:hypothetical protein
VGTDCRPRDCSVVRPAPPALTFEKRPQWDAAAEAGLALALGDWSQAIRDGVNAGRMELWRIDGDSWAVTECRAGVLIVWCYQGRQVRRVAEVLKGSLVKNGLDTLEFSTKRKGLHRLLAPLGFELAAVDDGDIRRYQVTA